MKEGGDVIGNNTYAKYKCTTWKHRNNNGAAYIELQEEVAPVGVEDNDAPPAYTPNIAHINVNTGREGGSAPTNQ